MYDDESDSDKPDENQIELVKKLHREMADRRIIVNMKNKVKNKKECVYFEQNSAKFGPKWPKIDSKGPKSVHKAQDRTKLPEIGRIHQNMSKLPDAVKIT